LYGQRLLRASCCLLPILAVTCATQSKALKPDDPLVGTWINEDYDKLEKGWIAKAVVSSDLRELDYTHIADAQPMQECRHVLEEMWVDAEGNHWYKLRTTMWAYPSGAGKVEGYSLTRINSAGTIFEGVFAQYGYPPTVDPLGPSYGIMYQHK
jgi:hypothetical protein